mgnify:CR=1 FL=1
MRPDTMDNTKLALYGNTQLIRAYCKDCNQFSFVIDSLLQCCEKEHTESPTHIKRMTETDFRRKLPPLNQRKQVLEAQNNQCIYCERTLNQKTWKGSQWVRLRVHWDHWVPFIYSQNNSIHNFVASCHLCNSLKGTLIFDDLDKAKIYLNQRWIEKGWSK